MADSVLITESDGDADCCPICLRSVAEASRSRSTNDPKSAQRGGVEFVYSRSCGHMFCRTCIQQLLLAPNSSKRTTGVSFYSAHDETTSPVAPVVTTTQGICPMCRAAISYFELCSCYFEGGSIIKTNDLVVTSDPVPDVLCNSIFSNMKQMEGFTFKISFPSTFEENGEHVLIGVSSSDSSLLSISLMKFHYLSATHTLFLMGNERDSPSGDYPFGVRVWVTFSDNFQFITHGVVCLTDVLESSADVNNRLTDHDVRQVGLGGSNGLLVHRYSADSAPNDGIRRAPCYSEVSLWGNVFCQQLTVGMASYHFLPTALRGVNTHTLGEAYISYEHAVTAIWPPLDNGRPTPSRVKFRDIVCPDPHTFRASICWLQEYNTTWNGASRWEYEMKFDTAYMCIISGTVKSVVIHEDVDTNTVNETVITLSSYGTELNYINAGLFDEFRKNYTTAFRDDGEANARSPSLAVIDRLVGEGAPGHVMADIIHVRDASEMVAPGENRDVFNPIDLRFFYS